MSAEAPQIMQNPGDTRIPGDYQLKQPTVTLIFSDYQEAPPGINGIKAVRLPGTQFTDGEEAKALKETTVFETDA